MFPEQFKKILNLVKQTGDRVIIFDPNAPNDSYVIMGFDNYAGLVDKGIAVKENLVKKDFVSTNTVNQEFSQSELSLNSDKAENLTEEDLTDKINREISMWKNREDLSFSAEENKPKKAWQIPPQVKDKAQEVN